MPSFTPAVTELTAITLNRGQIIFGGLGLLFVAVAVVGIILIRKRFEGLK